MSKKVTKLAIWSLILGILGVFILGAVSFIPGFVFGSFAIVLGFIALSKIRQSPTLIGGRDLAITGIFLGCFLALIFLSALFCFKPVKVISDSINPIISYFLLFNLFIIIGGVIWISRDLDKTKIWNKARWILGVIFCWGVTMPYYIYKTRGLKITLVFIGVEFWIFLYIILFTPLPDAIYHANRKYWQTQNHSKRSSIEDVQVKQSWVSEERLP